LTTTTTASAATTTTAATSTATPPETTPSATAIATTSDATTTAAAVVATAAAACSTIVRALALLLARRGRIACGQTCGFGITDNRSAIFLSLATSLLTCSRLPKKEECFQNKKMILSGRYGLEDGRVRQRIVNSWT
jgi:hypothetical protein